MPEIVEPVRRGRQVGWRKPPIQTRAQNEASTFSVERWCLDADVSRTWLYGEWGRGAGPKRVRVGGKVLISESPREYCERVAREQAAA